MNRERLKRAQLWLDGAPRLTDVLHWHVVRCPDCGRFTPRCPEWHEIIDDYNPHALSQPGDIW